MPDQLTTTQLEAIQRLIIEPLRSAVRAEMQAGHERLAASIDKVTDQLAHHMTSTIDGHRARDARIEQLERRLATLERFRAKVLFVYGVLTVLCTLAWSVLRDWLSFQARR